MINLRNSEWYKNQQGLEGDNHSGDALNNPRDNIERPPPWMIPDNEYNVIHPEQWEEDTILKDKGFVIEDISARAPASDASTDRYGRTITKRGDVLPFVEYDDGSTSLGMPKWVHGPLEAYKRLRNYQPGTQDEQAVRDSFEVAGAITGGSSAFSRPSASLGMGGSPKRWTDEAIASLAQDKASGLSYAEIGSKHGIDRTQVYQLLKKHDLKGSGTKSEGDLLGSMPVDRFGRAIQQSLNEGYGTALEKRDYTKRLLETGASNEAVAQKLYDRYGRPISPDEVRQRNMWQGTNERYIQDRQGRSSSIIKDGSE